MSCLLFFSRFLSAVAAHNNIKEKPRKSFPSFPYIPDSAVALYRSHVRSSNRRKWWCQLNPPMRAPDNSVSTGKAQKNFGLFSFSFLGPLFFFNALVHIKHVKYLVLFKYFQCVVTVSSFCRPEEQRRYNQLNFVVWFALATAGASVLRYSLRADRRGCPTRFHKKKREDQSDGRRPYTRSKNMVYYI